jgi:hypothetical protein
MESDYIPTLGMKMAGDFIIVFCVNQEFYKNASKFPNIIYAKSRLCSFENSAKCNFYSPKNNFIKSNITIFS